MCRVQNRGPTDLDGLAEVGAIILCGGQSRRMGRDKATLPLGPTETMLQRVVRLVGEVVTWEQLVCAAAPGQTLPDLPPGVRVVYDAQPHSGPLAGLAAGLKALQNKARVVYVTGCDAPMLVPGFVRRMFDLLDDYEIAAPHDGERFHPLSAVYCTAVLSAVEKQLAGHDRSLVGLLGACRTRLVPAESLRDVDPGLVSLAGCNSLQEYEEILDRVSVHEPKR